MGEFGPRSRPCCSNGSILLPELRSLPPALLQLFIGQDVYGKFFRSHIRQYNNAYCFASLNCNEVQLGPGGPPTFRVGGTTHHLIGLFVHNY